MRGSVRRYGTSAACALLLAGLGACYGARATGVDPAGGEDDARSAQETPQPAVAGEGAMSGAPEAPVPPSAPNDSQPGGADGDDVPFADPGDEPEDPAPVADYEIPLDAEQAACLGLDQPVCAACHGFHGEGIIVLRPEGAPPHPPGTHVGDLPRLRECGFAD